jgi:hypothetical protein
VVERLSRTQKTTAAASAMKIPMCRPWSSGSPQKTGSLALAAISLDTGTDCCAGSEFCSGPLSWNR